MAVISSHIHSNTRFGSKASFIFYVSPKLNTVVNAITNTLNWLCHFFSLSNFRHTAFEGLSVNMGSHMSNESINFNMRFSHDLLQ